MRQPQRPALVSTVDYHTAGEPFRIVTGGVPSLPGSCVAERREHAAAHLDHLRRLLVQEPRGHGGMYGCFVTPPDDQGAELGAVFFHQSGFSTACGHGTIALATWAADAGLVAADAGAFSIDVPSGRAGVRLRRDAGGRVSAVSFRNVPRPPGRAHRGDRQRVHDRPAPVRAGPPRRGRHRLHPRPWPRSRVRPAAGPAGGTARPCGRLSW